MSPLSRMVRLSLPLPFSTVPTSSSAPNLGEGKFVLEDSNDDVMMLTGLYVDEERFTVNTCLVDIL